MLPLRSMRNMNSPWTFLRSELIDLRSGQKLIMTTGLWRMSLWSRLWMISTWWRIKKKRGFGSPRGHEWIDEGLNVALETKKRGSWWSGKTEYINYCRCKKFQAQCGEPLERFHRNTLLWSSVLFLYLLWLQAACWSKEPKELCGSGVDEKRKECLDRRHILQKRINSMAYRK